MGDNPALKPLDCKFGQRSLHNAVLLTPNSTDLVRADLNTSHSATDMAFDYGHGDITIHVKNEQSNGRDAIYVSSHAMRRASKVWYTMLSGSFAEGRGETTILDYTEDATQAVLIVMDIIHLRLDRVPAILSLRGLRDLAVFTDKFDITHIVVPWLSVWLAPHGTNIDQMGSGIDWLWIAWEYGLVSVFKHVGKRLAFGSSRVARFQPWGVSASYSNDLTDAAMLPPGTKGKRHSSFP